jgi:retinol dehydrogenase 12
MSELEGKTFVITGANTGIGRVTAVELARRGGRVILACRSRERTEEALKEIEALDLEPPGFVALDLGSLSSVKAAAAEILEQTERIDGLINNAGLSASKGLTEEGYELAFGVNYLGHFLLTRLLLDRLKESAPARIVHVASRAHKRTRRGIVFEDLKSPAKSASGFEEYAASKLANILFNAELGRRLEGTGVNTYAVHPGVVATDIWRRLPGFLRPMVTVFMLSPEEGAVSTLHCATSDEVAEENGLYYDERGRVSNVSRRGSDEEMARKLWEFSEEAVAELLAT